MIASLSGVLESVTENACIVDVGGGGSLGLCSRPPPANPPRPRQPGPPTPQNPTYGERRGGEEGRTSGEPAP